MQFWRVLSEDVASYHCSSQMHVLENVSTASSTSVHGLGSIPVRLSMVLFILVTLRSESG